MQVIYTQYLDDEVIFNQLSINVKEIQNTVRNAINQNKDIYLEL